MISITEYHTSGSYKLYILIFKKYSYVVFLDVTQAFDMIPIEIRVEYSLLQNVTVISE